MKEQTQIDFGALIEAFELSGTIKNVSSLGNGHIHHTYLVTLESEDRYVMQQINMDVFHDIPAIMENMNRVTAHINSRRHGKSRWQSLRPQVSVSDDILHRTPEGDPWRCCEFIERTTCHESITTDAVAYQAGRGFGMFQADLADLPGTRLHETLPRFHDTPWRFKNLNTAISHDAHDRVTHAGAEIAFVQARQHLAGRLLNLHRANKIPERITHNDTKLNNILLDSETHAPVCVLDLDTVMPGLSLYDFGDLIRSAAGTVPEDHPVPAEMEIRPDIYHAIAKGFIDGSEDLLLPIELELMPFSAMLITMEIGVRFLTDYLEGDTYFKTKYDNHNLERCRTQFALAASIEAQEDALRAAL